jgi:predicted DNA-binding transcriptional regulator AlpA
LHEAAQVLGVHRSTVHRLVERGALQKVKYGSRGAAWISTVSIRQLLGERVEKETPLPAPLEPAPRRVRAMANLLIASVRNRDT